MALEGLAEFWMCNIGGSQGEIKLFEEHSGVGQVMKHYKVMEEDQKRVFSKYRVGFIPHVVIVDKFGRDIRYNGPGHYNYVKKLSDMVGHLQFRLAFTPTTSEHGSTPGSSRHGSMVEAQITNTSQSHERLYNLSKNNNFTPKPPPTAANWTAWSKEEGPSRATVRVTSDRVNALGNRLHGRGWNTAKNELLDADSRDAAKILGARHELPEAASRAGTRSVLGGATTRNDGKRKTGAVSPTEPSDHSHLRRLDKQADMLKELRSGAGKSQRAPGSRGSS